MMSKYATVTPGMDIPIIPSYRYMRVVATSTSNQPLELKMEYFNDDIEEKTFNNCINRALHWLKRWKR